MESLTLQELTHKLSNPLSSILVYTQLLLEQPLEEPIRADLQEIQQEALRLQAILREAQERVRGEAH